MSLPNGFAAAPGGAARPLHFIGREQLAEWRGRQPRDLGQWMDAHRFEASAGSMLVLPGADGIAGAVVGIGDARDPFSYAHAPFALPEGDWRAEGTLDDETRRALQLGWGLGSYRFARFRKPVREPARLVLDGGVAVAWSRASAARGQQERENNPRAHASRCYTPPPTVGRDVAVSRWRLDFRAP